MTKISEYKGYNIEFDDSDGRFYVPKKEDGQVIKVASAATMKEMKAAIDRISKTHLLETSVFLRVADERIVKAKITSFRDSKYSYDRRIKEFRVTWSAKKGSYEWRNLTADEILKDTPQNVAKILEYNKLIDDSITLQEKARLLLKQMAVYTEKELLGE